MLAVFGAYQLRQARTAQTRMAKTQFISMLRYRAKLRVLLCFGPRRLDLCGLIGRARSKKKNLIKPIILSSHYQRGSDEQV